MIWWSFAGLFIIALLIYGFVLYRLFHLPKRIVLPREPVAEKYDMDIFGDGFGNEWVRCSPNCDAHVVRPGKVQCSCEEET